MLLTPLDSVLGGQERRNTENIAEAVEGGVVRTMQKFVAQAVWDDCDVLREVRRHVSESLGDEDGTVNVDETGFPKKGEKSVGVKRQYSGTLGRVENCQVGVFANYCSSKGHTMMDRRLFLPNEWAEDATRREEGGGRGHSFLSGVANLAIGVDNGRVGLVESAYLSIGSSVAATEQEMAGWLVWRERTCLRRMRWRLSTS